MEDKYISSYADEVGGIFSFGDFEIIPFNHWKKDIEWMVYIKHTDEEGVEASFVSVQAYSPKSAAQKALRNYLTCLEYEDE